MGNTNVPIGLMILHSFPLTAAVRWDLLLHLTSIFILFFCKCMFLIAPSISLLHYVLFCFSIILRFFFFFYCLVNLHVLSVVWFRWTKSWGVWILIVIRKRGLGLYHGKAVSDLSGRQQVYLQALPNASCSLRWHYF